MSDLPSDGSRGDWKHTVSTAFRNTMRNTHDTSDESVLKKKINERKALFEERELELAEWPPVSLSHLDRNVDPRREQFREWLRQMLFTMSHLLLDADGDKSAEVWSSVLSCMVSLCAYKGHMCRDNIDDFPVGALAYMLRISREQFWPPKVQSFLGIIAVNLLYTHLQEGETSFMKRKIDFERLEKFGGISEVVKQYHNAPTFQCSEAFFCIIFDYILHSKNQGADQQATWKFSISETFEAQAMGHALYKTKAAHSLKEYLILPETEIDVGIKQHISDHLLSQIRAKNYSSIDEVPDAFVDFCVNALKMAGSSINGIPEALKPHVDSTCTAGIFGETSSIHWKYLEEILLNSGEGSEFIGAQWMTKLMLAAADRSVEEAWLTKKNIVPAPVPLVPSDLPGEELYTFGETLLSAIRKERSQISAYCQKTSAIQMFACAIQEVVGAMRLQSLRLNPSSSSETVNDLMVKWSSGSVDVNRLCISTIERAFEWVLKYNNSPGYHCALLRLSESLVEVLTVRRLLSAFLLGQHNDKIDHHEENELEYEYNTNKERNEGVRVPPLHIPSPTSTQGEETPSLSPLRKVPGAPKLAAAWRRLTSPHSAKRNQFRPASAEEPGDKINEELAARPLSAGAAVLDSHDISFTSRENSPKKPYNKSVSSAFTAGSGASSGRNRFKAWQSLEIKIQIQREIEKKQRKMEALVLCERISSFEECLNPVESFINGISVCSVETLELVRPIMLLEIFNVMVPIGEDVRSQGQPRSSASGHALPVLEQRHTDDHSNSFDRQAAVEAGRLYWDARLSIFMLLVHSFSMTDKYRHNHPLTSKTFLHKVLKDPDVRVRKQVCIFILQQFSEQQEVEYIKAMSSLVSRAQQANDEDLLQNPEMQLNKILEMRMFDVNSLFI